MSKYKKSTIIHGKVTKAQDKQSHYVDRKAFYQALVERKEIIASGTTPPVSEYIGECLLKIANGLASKWNFANYSYKEEMVGDAVIHCLTYVDKFDPTKSTNPFSYFTQACYFLFVNRIRDEKIEQYVKYKATLDSASMNEVAEQPDKYSDFDVDLSELDFSELESFVNEFETKERESKEKSVKKSSKKAKITLE
jgi:hypothetical protein